MAIEIFYLIIMGLFAGIISSFFGVGGGTIMIPFLSFIYPQIDHQYYIASSLGIILFNSISNSVSFLKYIRIDWKIVILISVFSILFSAVGSKIAMLLNNKTLQLIFMLFLAFFILPTAIRKKKNDSHLQLSSKGKKWIAALIGFLTGMVSGLTGLGGGSVNVPMMYRYLNIDFKMLSAYSNAIMIFTAFSAVITYAFSTVTNELSQFHIGYLLPQTVLFGFIGSYFGAQIGLYFHKKSQSEFLRKGFIVLLLLILSRLLYLMFFGG